MAQMAFHLFSVLKTKCQSAISFSLVFNHDRVLVTPLTNFIEVISE